MLKQVAKAIIIDKGEALVLRLEPEEREKRGIDEWHVPGGSLEPEDSGVKDAAIREAKEETGLDIIIVRELGKARWSAFYNGKPSDFEATFVEAHLAPGQTRDAMMIDTTEAEQGVWIKPSDYADYPDLTDEAKEFISMVLEPSKG